MLKQSQFLITSGNLTFSKPNCCCGIFSSKKRIDFLKSKKKHSRKTKKHPKQTKH